MLYKVFIKPSALKEIEALPNAIRLRIKSKMVALSHDPRPSGARKLQASEKAWRIRVGEYRIVYEIEDDVVTVTIIRIAHRKDIYR